MLKNIWLRIKNSRRRTKVMAIFVVVIALFLVIRVPKKPVKIEYVAATKSNIASTVTASGILSGKNVAVLHFNSAGKLSYLPFNNGDIVIKGQVVASLDSTAANAAYQEALNTRRNTAANVDYVHDQVKDHSGDETFAQRASRVAAETANDSAYDGVLAAQKALNDTKLVSPISGIIVTQNNLNVGQNISPTDVIQVVDFSEKSFEATVDESDIGKIQIGQKAQITLNAYGDTPFEGMISEVGAATKTDTTGAITVTVKMTLNDNRISNIYGLNGNAIILTTSRENVLTIPQDALIDDTHVYVKTQNSNGKGQNFEKREITTGIKSDTDVEIINGLKEGDQVITNPQAVK